jgi:anti-anti-sigma factor
MVPNVSPSVSVSRRGSAHPGGHALRTVVWVRGEQDIATRVHLSVTIAQAARFDDADIVVDLSGVTFMDASTIGALVVARNRLSARSRSLCVRAPSPRARRVIDLCGLEGMIDEHPAPAQPPVATALGSWVDVPARDRDPLSTPPDEQQAPSQQPAHAMARRRDEPAGLVQQHRASS